MKHLFQGIMIYGHVSSNLGEQLQVLLLLQCGQVRASLNPKAISTMRINFSSPSMAKTLGGSCPASLENEGTTRICHHSATSALQVLFSCQSNHHT